MESKTMVWVVFALVLSVGAGSAIWGDNSSDSESVIVSVNGVVPTVENVSDGSYALCRDLALVVDENNTNAAVADFINWILSEEGQNIVEENGFASIDPVERVVSATSGSVNVSGSTTVLPLMQKLAEAYEKTTNITVSIWGGGSGAGIKEVENKISDIGMLSKDYEPTNSSLNVIKIASDGVIIVVDKSAGVTDLTLKEIALIFAGTYTNWSQVDGNNVAIKPIVRNNCSGTRNTLDYAIMDIMNYSEINLVCDYVSGGYPEVGFTGSMISFIKNTNGAIGYTDMYGAKNL